MVVDHGIAGQFRQDPYERTNASLHVDTKRNEYLGKFTSGNLARTDDPLPILLDVRRPGPTGVRRVIPYRTFLLLQILRPQSLYTG